MKILPFFLFIILSISLNGQVINKQESDKIEGIKRKSSFNVEEIKVRWKKAALENCTGVPCIITPPPPSFTCGTSTINDVDGNAYNTVLIGTQCWTLENLKVTKYNDGTSIPLDNSGGSTGYDDDVQTWSGQSTGAYTIYGNDANNLSSYGYLYNWYAASNSKGLCPTGWHVPTDEEWTTLTTFLGGESVAGGKMKSTVTQPTTGGWNTLSSSSVTNSSGFTALPGGFRNWNGNFDYRMDRAYFWSATLNGSNPYFRQLEYNTSSASSSFNSKELGCSVRCLRD